MNLIEQPQPSSKRTSLFCDDGGGAGSVAIALGLYALHLKRRVAREAQAAAEQRSQSALRESALPSL